MESIVSTFHIDWKIMIAQAINFVVVFVVLYIFALKPLSKLLTEREGKISKGVADAKSNAALLEQTKSEYEKVLMEAKAQANKIFQEGKKEAEAKKAEMMESAKVEVTGIINNGKTVLEAEKVKMVEEAKKEIVSLTLKTVEKLLGEKMDGSYDAKIIKELNQL